MSWRTLNVAADGTHHIDAEGNPAYTERFDEVLKFHSPGFAPVLRDGAAWHIRPDGSAAYTCRHRRTFGFYGGLAATAGDDGWHHITTTGRAAYLQRYDWCGNFQGGFCTVRDKDGAYLHITPHGSAVYAERWRYAGDYRDGVAVVQAESGLSTHIDLAGHLVHERWYVDLDVFHKGYARARDEDGWCHVDANGCPVYERRFAAIEPFYNGQARVERFDGALEAINESGQALIELRPPRRSEFAELSSDLVGFWRTQTIGAAVTLGVPEALPASEAAVAEQCGLTAVGARRLLRALGELRLAASEADMWKLTERGKFLGRGHPLTLADAAIEYAGPFTRMWSDLPQALSASSGWSAPDVFGEVAADSTRREGHHRMLRSYARHDYPLVIDALDIGDADRVVDAGGGLGTLARLLVEKQPALNITVLERPEVVEAGRRENADLSVQWHEADLLEPWGVQADIVILSRVLHDWDDVEAERILEHARKALAPNGRVFIIEMLVPEDTVAGAQCDLHLLMATGGRERSGEHYGLLLGRTGFKPMGVHHVAALPSIVVGMTT
jgi:SAM-dependent methyltransferase